MKYKIIAFLFSLISLTLINYALDVTTEAWDIEIYFEIAAIIFSIIIGVITKSRR